MPHFDEAMGEQITEWFTGAQDFLLGRTTYEIFYASWPKMISDDPVSQGLNFKKKYVASRTLDLGRVGDRGAAPGRRRRRRPGAQGRGRRRAAGARVGRADPDAAGGGPGRRAAADRLPGDRSARASGCSATGRSRAPGGWPRRRRRRPAPSCSATSAPARSRPATSARSCGVSAVNSCRGRRPTRPPTRASGQPRLVVARSRSPSGPSPKKTRSGGFSASTTWSTAPRVAAGSPGVPARRLALLGGLLAEGVVGGDRSWRAWPRSRPSRWSSRRAR